MFILTNMITCCLVLNEGSNLWPLPHLAEEVLLLGQHFQFLMTKLLPRTINLHAFISIYLSLDYLMSSSTAHGLILVSGPFIPTIAPRNSFFFSLGKRGISIYWQLSFSLLCHFFLCRCLFNCKEARSWRFGIWDASTFISFGTLSPTFYGMMEILWWRNFMGIWDGTLPLTFPFPIYIARRF